MYRNMPGGAGGPSTVMVVGEAPGTPRRRYPAWVFDIWAYILQYTCIICHCLLWNPHMIDPCGHRVCRDCIDERLRVQQGETECDGCRKEHVVTRITQDAVLRDSACRRQMRSLVVHCPNRTQGCHQTLPFCQLDVHIVQCLYPMTNQPPSLLEEQNRLFRAIARERDVSGEIVMLERRMSIRAEHQPQSSVREVLQMMAGHIAQDVFKELTDRYIQSTRQLEMHLVRLEGLHRRWLSQMPRANYHVAGTLSWAILGFRGKLNNRNITPMLTSSEISANGIQYRLNARIYLAGHQQGRESHLSAYVHVRERVFGHMLQQTGARIRFTLVNFSDNGQDHVAECAMSFPQPGSDAISGCPRFLLLETFLERFDQFVCGDTLILKVEILARRRAT